jgi:hypothetical protein
MNTHTTDLAGPGDIVLLESGDKIPADLRLIEVKNLRTEEAALTGESAPADKSTDAAPEKATVGDRHNLGFSGTMVVSSELDLGHFERVADQLAAQGERVLALAWLEDPGAGGRRLDYWKLPRRCSSASTPPSAPTPAPSNAPRPALPLKEPIAAPVAAPIAVPLATLARGVLPQPERTTAIMAARKRMDMDFMR